MSFGIGAFAAGSNWGKVVFFLSRKIHERLTSYPNMPTVTLKSFGWVRFSLSLSFSLIIPLCF